MRIVKNLLIALIIIWGLLALTVRLATPFIADYRDELAALLSAQLGTPVGIDSLKARWFGLGPLLDIRGVTIGGTKGPLQIASISLNLAPFSLITGSTLDALRVTIEGMQLTLVREPSGQIHLEGIGLIGSEQAEGSGAPPLPSHFRLVDTHIVWIDRKAGKAPLHIDNVSVVLNRDGSRLGLRARLETASGKADLSAQLDGFLTTQEWSGETYLRIDNLDVAHMFARYLPANYGLRRMQLGLESWGTWHDAAPVHSQGRFQLRNLELHPRGEGAVPLDLAEARADFSVQRRPGGLRFGLKDLFLNLDGKPWTAGDLAFDLTTQVGGVRQIAVAADYLRVQDVVAIMQVRLPLAELQQPIEFLRPKGVIRDLRLAAEMAPDRFDWRGKAGFEDIETAAWGAAPGVDGLSGRLHGQQDHLVLQLDSRDARVRFKELFRDPLQLLQLTGRVDVVRDGDGWQVSSDRLLANTPHILTRTRLLLEKQPDRPLFLDLQTDFKEGDAAFALHYYPASIMPPKVVNWLDGAIKSGRVPGGSALLHGPLDSFPYEKTTNGSFQVVFDTENIELDYLNGWPKLEQVNAHLKFHANSLDIDVQSATVYDSRVVDTKARIASLNPASPLRMQGRAVGPLHNILQMLREDGLRGDFGDIATALQAKGDSELRLEFAIPMSAGDKYELQGQLQLDDAALSLPDWGFAMTHVNGKLKFDLSSVSAQGVQARALGAPVRVDVLPGDGGVTRVRTRGKLKVDDIQQQLPTLPLQIAAGEADFVIDVDIPPRGRRSGNPVLLGVSTDFMGIQISLPAPFGKPADEARPLAVQIPLGDSPNPGTLSYGDLVKARFSSDGKRIDVVLGGDEPSPGPDPGIRIGGRLGQLDLRAWSEALEPLAGTDTSDPPPLSIDLQLERLFADFVGIDDLKLNATLEQGIWRGTLDAPDLAGSFVAQSTPTQTPIRVDLQHLNLTVPVAGDDFEVAPVPNPDSGPDPSTLPGLALNIDELKINQAQLGRLQLDALRAPEGLRLTQLSLRGGQLELDSAGHWSRLGSGYETRWGGRISTADLGDLLVDLGYSRQVEKTGGSIEWLLHWPGNPAQFHRATQAGIVSLDVDAGRVVELDPGVSRVVGLLNLNALTRRLRLDFSDIYKKGYSFDSIEGDFGFRDGQAKTDNLRVLGPSGRIDLKGSANLITRSLDQHVTVTPSLDATLPIASTLAGGPIAGVAVLVAQKVMTKQVDQIYRFEYSLSGPWNEPKVIQLDSGGPLSRILKQLRSDGVESASQETTAPVQTPADTDLPEAVESPPPTTPPLPVDAAAEAGAASTPPQPGSTKGDEQQGPLRDLIDVLKESKSHGGDLPGASD